MDPITALQVAGAILQFVELAAKVSTRLSEYLSACPGDIPKPLESTSIRLPLLISALSRIQSETQLRKYDGETRSILHGVVVGCLKLVRDLDRIAARITPRPGEDMKTKLKKVVRSLKDEEKIVAIDRSLQTHIQLLILHQVVDGVDIPIEVEERDLFCVKEKRIVDFVPRPNLTQQLDSLFYAAVRSQTQQPIYVSLFGKEGAGKTQLAVEYCHQAHDLGQFPTIFWLDAADPERLMLGLESVAAEIRRTRVGTREDKVRFVEGFFANRWHPWLLVLDDYNRKAYYDTPLHSLLPDQGCGAILIISRRFALSEHSSGICVPKYLSPSDEKALRQAATKALRSQNLHGLRDAIENGLDPNSRSVDGWQRDGEPIMNLSARLGNEEAFEFLLAHGADPTRDIGSGSALYAAVRSGSLHTIDRYLDHEEETGIVPDQEIYDWAFWAAIECDQVNALAILFKRRGKMLDPDRPRLAEPFSRAAASGNIKILRYLLSRRKLPADEKLMVTLLSKAIGSRSFDMVRFLVSEAKINLGVTDPFSDPPLHDLISMTCRVDEDAQLRDSFITLLLTAGASPNQANHSNHRTSLHVAILYGDPSTIAILLEHGADVKIKDEDGRTALLMAVNRKNPECWSLLTNNVKKPDTDYFSRPLVLAAEKGNRELAVMLLNNGGDVVDIIDQTSGDTPLLAAIKHHQGPTARMLLRRGANPSQKDKSGQPALCLAAQLGLDQVVKDIATALNALPEGLAQARDRQGNTALMVAVTNKHSKTVEVLLGLGVDREEMNIFGETALEVAENKGFKDIVKLLA